MAIKCQKRQGDSFSTVVPAWRAQLVRIGVLSETRAARFVTNWSFFKNFFKNLLTEIYNSPIVSSPSGAARPPNPTGR